MSAPLFTKAQRAQLLANGEATARGDDHDPRPAVKLFTPDAGAAWLLTEIDPADPDIAFGLCDLGLGFPELGAVSLRELTSIRGKLGLTVEPDRHFTARFPLSVYAEAASQAQHITLDEQALRQAQAALESRRRRS